MLNACTIIARNYLPFGRVLAESFFAHHPDASFTILVVDDEQRELGGDRRIAWKRLGDLGLDDGEIRRLAAIYDVTELATAVKPLLLRCLLDEGASEAVYLDPDICIYDSLDDLATLVERHGIVLTPHTTAPFPRDDRDVDAAFILSAGVYNLGFIAVGPTARPFLAWWWDCTRREALSDVARMMFTDQRVVDFVPALFEPSILKDPGYNVAYWNLHGREVTADGPGYAVNQAPLRFFHFSGFDIRSPWLLSRNQGKRPRILLSERPVVRALCRDYAARVLAAADASDADRPYGWGRLPSGTAITTRMRRLYWKALVAAERHGSAEPPNPFDPANPEAFVGWLREPSDDGPRTLSRYLYSIYLDRADLQVHFRDIHGADAVAFVEWLWQGGIAPETIPLELLPSVSPAENDAQQVAVPPLAPGVLLVAGPGAETAAGEVARLLASALDAAAIPHASVDVGSTVDREPLEDGGSAFDINLLCLDADRLRRFARDTGPAFFAGRYTVGYCFFEIAAAPPTGWASAFAAVDEIWAPTDVAAAALREVSRKPVFTVPLPIRVPAGVVRGPRTAGARFRFLTIVDFLLGFERQNPLGAIEALTRAFTPDEEPELVIRTVNGHLRLNDLEHLRAAAGERPDIHVHDGRFAADEIDALLAGCDAYLSLDRWPETGLWLGEAMALATPVIVLAPAGPRRLLTAENSYLVNHALMPVPPGCAGFPEPAAWAEPDLDHAARLIREVVDRPADADARARRGQADVLASRGLPVAAAALSARLQEIRRDRSSRVTMPALAIPKENPMSRYVPHPPGTLVSGPIDEMLPHLEQLATPRVSSVGGTLGGLRLAAQRLLFRVLRPYWFQQYQLHRHVIATFGRVATALQYEQQQREALDGRVRELTGELVACRRELRRQAGEAVDRRHGPRRDDQGSG